MDDLERRARVAAARVAHLATVRADGRPHVVPCCTALAGDTLYSPIDSVKAKTTLALQRLDNITAHPEVTVLVDHYAEDWSNLWWVRLDGIAEIIDDGVAEHALGAGLLIDKYDQYDDADAVAGPLIAVRVTGWRSWP